MVQRICRLLVPPLVVIVALVVYRVGFWAAGGPPVRKIVPPRAEPLKITTRFNEPRIVTDEQLVAVLDRVTPPKTIETNNMVHALRLWGAEAEFGDKSIPSGQKMREYILKDEVFSSLAGAKTLPLITRTKAGLTVRSYDDTAVDRISSSYHTDDLLATLAESGTPLVTPIHLRDGSTATVQDLLVDSLSSFHLSRHEYEWSTICYARYLFPLKSWDNKYGEKIDVAALVDELINHPLDAGPCNGLHRFEAMVVLYRADEELHQLPPKTREKMLSHMRGAARLLAVSQHPDGYWNRHWPRGRRAFEVAAKKGEKGAEAKAPAQDDTPLHDKLLVTGHQLEWLALAPEEIQPPREQVVRAGQWLSRTLVEMDEKALLETYGPYSHAARALCMWRGVDPYTVWKAAHPEVGAAPVAAAR